MENKNSAFLNHVQENLRLLMKSQKLTIKELEDISGVSEPTIKRLRTQKISPNTSIDVLNKLANALGVSILELMQQPNENHTQLEIIPDNTANFTYVFKRRMFDFLPGSKAVFKEYDHIKNNLTKYFFDAEFNLYMVISKKENEVIAKNNDGEVCTLQYSDISSVITKKLYDTNEVETT